MSVHEDDVDHIATLARLRLTGRERAEMTQQLGRILAYVEQLQQVDVSDVPPTTHVVEVVNVDRGDVPCPGIARERVFDNAPAEDEGHFVVPRAIPAREG